MNIQRIALYIDLLFCLIFLPLIISMVPVEKWLVRYPLFACTLFLSLYVVYFAIRKMNIPRKAMQRKYVQIGVFVVVIIGAAYLLSQFPYPPGYEIQNTSCPNMRRILRRQTVCFMFLVVGSDCFWSMELSSVPFGYWLNVSKGEFDTYESALSAGIDAALELITDKLNDK